MTDPAVLMHHGVKGVVRINSTMNEGKTHDEAHKIESNHTRKVAAIALGSAVALRILAGQLGAASIRSRRSY